MDLSALLERYQTLLPWNLARTKCFVNMIVGMIASGSVQQHKTALGFIGIAKQKSVCARIRHLCSRDRLIKARFAAKMSQMEVAKKMHTSQSHIARLESGCHFPTIQTLHKYARAINRKICLEIKP